MPSVPMHTPKSITPIQNEVRSDILARYVQNEIGERKAVSLNRPIQDLHFEDLNCSMASQRVIGISTY